MWIRYYEFFEKRLTVYYTSCISIRIVSKEKKKKKTINMCGAILNKYFFPLFQVKEKLYDGVVTNLKGSHISYPILH